MGEYVSLQTLGWITLNSACLLLAVGGGASSGLVRVEAVHLYRAHHLRQSGKGKGIEISVPQYDEGLALGTMDIWRRIPP